MNANSRRGFVGAVLGGVLLLLLQGGIALAQEAPEKERREVTPTTSEVVAAIKRRAQQILEERRRARQLRFSWDTSQLIGWESNPANNSAHKGDTYVEHTLSLNLSKKLTPTLTWQGSYYGSFDNYFEYGDGDYTSQTLTPTKFLWQPGRMWRVDAGVELGDTWYPKSGPSNYRELKPSIGVRQNLWGRWFHAARYEWFVRHYISKRARDGASVETLTPREDTRHRFRYELGTTWKETLLKVKQEWYLHDSNDARQDFYDAEDYKVTASINRPLSEISEKLSVNASYSFERKSYKHRQVSGITAEARYDDTHTWTAGGNWDFNKTWSFAPTVSYKYLDSNDPTGEYFDLTVSGAVSARF